MFNQRGIVRCGCFDVWTMVVSIVRYIGYVSRYDTNSTSIDTNRRAFICLCILFQQDRNLSSGIFFLELLSAVEPRVVNWSLVTKGETGM